MDNPALRCHNSRTAFRRDGGQLQYDIPRHSGAPPRASAITRNAVRDQPGMGVRDQWNAHPDRTLGHRAQISRRDTEGARGAASDRPELCKQSRAGSAALGPCGVAAMAIRYRPAEPYPVRGCVRGPASEGDRCRAALEANKRHCKALGLSAGTRGVGDWPQREAMALSSLVGESAGSCRTVGCCMPPRQALSFASVCGHRFASADGPQAVPGSTVRI